MLKPEKPDPGKSGIHFFVYRRLYEGDPSPSRRESSPWGATLNPPAFITAIFSCFLTLRQSHERISQPMKCPQFSRYWELSEDPVCPAVPRRGPEAGDNVKTKIFVLKIILPTKTIISAHGKGQNNFSLISSSAEINNPPPPRHPG